MGRTNKGESKFSPAEDKIILAKDNTLPVIAYRMGRTFPSVQNRRAYLLHRINRQGLKLTDKEIEILKLLAHGWTDKHIGTMLGRSYRTIEEWRKTIIQKLGARNVVHAVSIGYRKKILKLK
jgi:DNA-binding NarL/FixJ family response regulator